MVLFGSVLSVMNLLIYDLSLVPDLQSRKDFTLPVKPTQGSSINVCSYAVFGLIFFDQAKSVIPVRACAH